MCLSIPAKIIDIHGSMAQVSIGGTILNADIQMLESVKAGDYILLHAGFAIQKISEEEAMESFRMLREMDEQTGNQP